MTRKENLQDRLNEINDKLRQADLVLLDLEEAKQYLLEALKEEEEDELPLFFTALNNPTGAIDMLDERRLVVKVTDNIKKEVEAGSEYISLCPGGSLGSKGITHEYINKYYGNIKPVFSKG